MRNTTKIPIFAKGIISAGVLLWGHRFGEKERNVEFEAQGSKRRAPLLSMDWKSQTDLIGILTKLV